MEMKQNSYFANNERLMNQILLRVAEVLFFVGPLLAVFNFEGLYNIRYEECALISIFDILVVLVVIWFGWHESMKPAVKYVLLFGLQIGICWVAAMEGMNIYIAYALIPAVSCLYFNRRFTLYITGGSYLVMLLSLWPRAGMEVNLNYPNLTQWDWFGAFGFGLTVEFLLLVLILVALTGKIQNTLEVLQLKNTQMKEMQRQLVSGFANLIESRDNDTGHHVRRTSEYVRMIANWLRDNRYYTAELSIKAVNDFAMAAPLHDTGKICIPDSILKKEGALTPEEYDIMKQHTTQGYRLIRDNLGKLEDRRLLTAIENTALYHHERWDGTGYPKGISGREIPLCARIMAAADTLDALLSERCYKKCLNMTEVMEIFEKERGTHFEPCIVDAVRDLEPMIMLFIQEEEEYEHALRQASGDSSVPTFSERFEQLEKAHEVEEARKVEKGNQEKTSISEEAQAVTEQTANAADTQKSGRGRNKRKKNR